jgi:hypothetical protein
MSGAAKIFMKKILLIDPGSLVENTKIIMELICEILHGILVIFGGFLPLANPEEER